jgi:hypothetical protein
MKQLEDNIGRRKCKWRGVWWKLIRYSTFWFMKETDKEDFIKMKSFFPVITCQENEKTSHRLRENLCKRHTTKKGYPKYKMNF